jgi:hypothetical protein
MVSGFLAEAADPKSPLSSAPAPVPALARPVYAVGSAAGGGRLVMDSHARAEHLSVSKSNVVFLAFPATNWWMGLVPLFAVEREGRFELRRRAARGEENTTEPFCFILPLADEPMAGAIAGAWDCTGTRPGGATSWFGWELAVEGENLSGRFEQGSEFRVAYLTGGTVRSNRVRLTVEYVMDHYELAGEWRAGEMSGTWRQVGEESSGVWRAKRVAGRDPGLGRSPAEMLYEYRHRREGTRRYATAAELEAPDWERSARPLGRVWPAR